MKKFLSAFCLSLVFLLAGCSSKFNNDNFSKIEVGQTEQQVKDLLGTPNSVESSGALGLTATTYKYEKGGNTGEVSFVNGKVISKSGSFK